MKAEILKLKKEKTQLFLLTIMHLMKHRKLPILWVIHFILQKKQRRQGLI